MKLKIISVAGARPNFMKVAPLHWEFKKHEDKVKHLICHTGQHYDYNMSKVFFDDLNLPEPNFYLGVGSGTHAEQTAKIMLKFEKIIIEEKPDLVIVVGDVNSTLACSLTAVKLGVKVAHVEAGLRSFDKSMPEEINRILTDHISDFLFVTEKSGVQNLKREGIDDKKIFFVGNVMIDTLIHLLPKIECSDILQKLNLFPKEYILVTLHRPSNVENENFLLKLVEVFQELSQVQKVIFPVHPRTRLNIEKLGLNGRLKDRVMLLEPLGYIDFINLLKNSSLVITDSGGVQEESTFLGIQCITVRNNTERPVTVEIGTNHLVGTDLSKVLEHSMNVLGGKIKSGKIPELWDGKSSKRIVEIILEHLKI